MTIDPQRLLAHRFADIPHSYSVRDTILYALGLGLGADPLDALDLGYLVGPVAKVLPMMAVTLSSPGMWVCEPSLGIDWVRLVHVEQEARFLSPLPCHGQVIGSARVASLHDRGAERGAVLVVERTIRDANSGTDYCTLRQTLLLRGDGGFGGEAPPAAVGPPVPDRDPDVRAAMSVSPRAALIYRLSGDWNPLHADPEVARKGGFERPILHGLASYGIAGHVVPRALGCDPTALLALSVRFAGIVFPGDRIDFAIWRDGDEVSFQGRIGNKIVLDRGRATLQGN
jgi:acyl dehydratase